MGGFGHEIWEDGVKAGMQQGKAEGKAEERNSILTLMQKLFAAGRIADAEKASSDMAYCDQLLTEYGLVK